MISVLGTKDIEDIVEKFYPQIALNKEEIGLSLKPFQEVTRNIDSGVIIQGYEEAIEGVKTFNLMIDELVLNMTEGLKGLIRITEENTQTDSSKSISFEETIGKIDSYSKRIIDERISILELGDIQGRNSFDMEKIQPYLEEYNKINISKCSIVSTISKIYNNLDNDRNYRYLAESLKDNYTNIINKHMEESHNNCNSLITNVIQTVGEESRSEINRLLSGLGLMGSFSNDKSPRRPKRPKVNA